MRTDKLVIGQIYKNYKELCAAIEEDVKAGNSKKAQLEKWEKYFSYKKDGQKFIIDDIKMMNKSTDIITKQKIQFTLTDEELIDTYGTNKQKEKYTNNGITPSMRMTILREASRFYNIEYNKKTKQYEVYDTYKYPVPKKMIYMKRGLYQYMIPLLLLKLKNDHDKNNKILISADNLAKMIYMHNTNYNAIKFNQNVICSEKVVNQNVKLGEYTLGFELFNSKDYFEKADRYISDYIEKALSMLEAIGVIHSQVTQMTIYTDKIKDEDKEDQVLIYNDGECCDEYQNIQGVVFRKKIKRERRRSTDKEIKDNLILQQETDKEVGLNTKEKGIQARYFGEKAKVWMNEYNKKLKEYCKDLDYDILGFCNYYEVYAGKLEQCDDCLQYFEYTDEDELIKNFNYAFYNHIINKAQIRLDKNNQHYNPSYIEDFANLAGITIFKENNIDTNTIYDTIRNNPLEFKVILEEY